AVDLIMLHSLSSFDVQTREAESLALVLAHVQVAQNADKQLPAMLVGIGDGLREPGRVACPSKPDIDERVEQLIREAVDRAGRLIALLEPGQPRARELGRTAAQLDLREAEARDSPGLTELGPARMDVL